MHKYAPLIIVVVLLVALAAVVVWAVESENESFDDLLVELELKDESAEGIEGSGFIEAEGVVLASQLGGKVLSVEVAEGDPVEEKTLLVVLDVPGLDAQIRQAEEAVSAAQAQLDRLRAGARPQEVSQAEAALARAEAASDGADKALASALRAREERREIELGTGVAESQVAVAERQLEAAQARLRAAEALEDQSLVTASQSEAVPEVAAEAAAGLQQAEDLRLQAELDVAMAEVDLALARELLVLQRERGDDPIELDSNVDAARMEADSARAARDEAEAQLDLLEEGASASRLRLAESALRQAEARLRSLEVQHEMASLESPQGGQVVEVFAEQGEAVAQGASLVRVAQLSPLYITIYVAETDVGDLEIGQPVELTVDAYDDETFDGEVVAIAAEAEFTPKNVQTKEDRADLVYAVRIRVPNADGDLRPGMPADAVISTD